MTELLLTLTGIALAVGFYKLIASQMKTKK